MDEKEFSFTQILVEKIVYIAAILDALFIFMNTVFWYYEDRGIVIAFLCGPFVLLVYFICLIYAFIDMQSPIPQKILKLLLFTPAICYMLIRLHIPQLVGTLYGG